MMKNNTKITLSRILKYVGKDKALLIISVILALVSVTTSLLIPKYIGDTIDLIISKNNVDLYSVKNILINVLVLILTSGLCQWIIASVSNRMSFNVSKSLRNDAFSKIQVLPLSYLDAHRTGETISKITNDVEQLTEGLLLGFSQLLTGCFTIIGTLVLMIIVNPWIALLVAFLTPISFFVAKFIAKKTFTMFLAQSEAKGEQTAFIEEAIGNQKLIKAFGKENDIIKDFDKTNETLEKCSFNSIFYSSTTNPATRFINNIIYALVALFGAIFIINGQLSIGMLSCLLNYANQYTKPFNEISSVIAEFQNALACAGRVFDFINTPEENHSKEYKTLSDVNGNINFNNVCFSYTKEKELIKNLSIKTTKGQQIAIVGPTGAGKTTLINILMRFYNIDSGSITVDNIDTQTIKFESLRSTIGMVLQDTWIKTGSIKENIKIGNPNATDDEIIAAAKESYAHNFIKRLPNGYDTIITDDSGLSQGEKQLLCITRLMLSTPPVLILDEATSSIDTRTEIKIQKAFKKLMNGRTTFIVAHRLSTILDSDLILVMNNGQVVEQGTHTDLLKEKGFYYSIYKSQFVDS